MLREYAARPPPGAGAADRPSLPALPVALIAGEEGRLAAIELVRNELAADDGRLRRQADGRARADRRGLVFRAIGYRGVPLPGVPFDERGGVIPNADGRVLDPSSGEPLPGEYVVGWIKRGPSGVIGTNKKDAQQTVDAMIADLTAPENGALASSPPAAPDPAAVEAVLRRASPSSSPTPAGLRSTATSSLSARHPGVPA